MRRGTLYLVVGPSGAGKDTLIAAAEAARPGLTVLRRVVTRAALHAAEAHDELDPARFEEIERDGGFLLSWRAHGHAYGLPASAAAVLDAGGDVLANVSRAVIGEARRRFHPVRVIVVEAAPDVLARRLAARGRESRAEIAGRLARAAAAPRPEGPDVTVVRNDGAVTEAVAAFLAALQPERV